MDPERPEPIADLVARSARGEGAATAALLPLVYRELRGLAASYLRRFVGERTLQPTALVHEAFLRLQRNDGGWNDRSHFMALAATAMRQILTDRARRRRAAKRGGGGRERVTLSQLAADQALGPLADLVALDDAMTKLAAADARQARVVELRIFGGLTVDEVAEALGLSPRTIATEWRRARAWLIHELGLAPP